MTSPEIRDALRRAASEIHELRSALERVERERNEPIAVIGMACRMPTAENLEDFWSLLQSGRDAVTQIPAERFDAPGLFDPDPRAAGKMSTGRGAFLRDIDLFDSAFFGISAREAAQMDPQQRLVLEVGWEALEHAGQPATRLSGSRTGVFIGVTTADYSQCLMQRGQLSELDGHTLTGGGLTSAFASGRLAYWLGLQGPSLTVDTACSSSLVAVHLAVQSLRTGDCEMALAGGVNVMLSPEWFVILSKAGMMAGDGKCKTFDKAADGYVRGEGCGVVVLKPLSAAQRDNDHILAVIRGSAVNQDGRSSGITVPNGSAQRAVIRDALRRAGLVGSDVSYVEAHGTGTALGDPIEVHALVDVLRPDSEAAEPLTLGSVKTNIGHLESAAGVAGLIKTVLAMQHEQLPPLLHLKEVNPEIPLDKLPISLSTTLRAWPRNGRPRVAGVSSFGASGTNSHVIVQEAPEYEQRTTAPDRSTHLVCLSARDGQALIAMAEQYVHHLETHPGENLGDLAFTANTGRARFNHRLAVRADSVDQLRRALATHLEGKADSAVRSAVTASGRRPKVGFLFTGQGSQYRAMGRELFETQPGFRADLEQCGELLRPHLDHPLLSVLFSPDVPDRLIDQTRYSQPVLFSLQYALARLWQSFGVQPSALLGHSVGEYAAACVAGVVSLEDGITLIAERGRRMQELPAGGAMAAICTGLDRVNEVLLGRGDIAVAAVNSPDDVVVAGATAAVDHVLEVFAAQGVRGIPLRVSHAFHSPLVEPMLDGFEAVAQNVAFAAPRLPLISGLTGGLAGRDTYNARYLRDHARKPVRFAEAIRVMGERGCRAFIEIGPSPVLCGLGRKTIDDPDVAWLPSLRPGQGDWQTLLDALAVLEVRGAEIEWVAAERPYRRRKVALPTYPFQRRRHWYKNDVVVDVAAKPAAATPVSRTATNVEPVTRALEPVSLLGRRVPSPFDVEQYEGRLVPELFPGLDENVVGDTPVVNAGFYLEAAMEAAADIFGTDEVCVDRLLLQQAMVMPPAGGVVTQLVATPTDSANADFQYFGSPSGATGTWSVYARGSISDVLPHSGPSRMADIEAAYQRCPQHTHGVRFYSDLWRRGLKFGPSSQRLESIRHGTGEAVSRIRPEQADVRTYPYRLDPGILDCALQTIFACVDDLPDDSLIMLVELERYVFHGYGGEQLICWTRLRPRTSADLLSADIVLLTENGGIVAELQGAHVRRASREQLTRAIKTPPKVAKADVVGRRSSPAETRLPSGPFDPAQLRASLIRGVAQVLGNSADEIEFDEPLQNLGLDSMMALELRDMLTREIGRTLPAATFLGRTSVSVLEKAFAEQLGSGSGVTVDPSTIMVERVGPGGMQVTELGSGQPVVFVHGGAFGGVEAWQAQLPLAARWHLIVPSRLNYGQSPTSIREDFEEDGKLIAELLGEGAHVVAQSYGTVGAMLAAAARPDAVLSLTLIESAASSVARGNAVVGDYERGMQRLLAQPPTEPGELLAAVFRFIDPDLSFPHPLPEELKRFADRIPQLRWPWEADIPVAALRAASFPTLVVTGGGRPVFEVIGDALADQLGAQRVTVPGGHGTQNVGGLFNAVLERFLNEASVPASARIGVRA